MDTRGEQLHQIDENIDPPWTENISPEEIETLGTCLFEAITTTSLRSLADTHTTFTSGNEEVGHIPNEKRDTFIRDTFEQMCACYGGFYSREDIAAGLIKANEVARTTLPQEEARAFTDIAEDILGNIVRTKEGQEAFEPKLAHLKGKKHARMADDIYQTITGNHPILNHAVPGQFNEFLNITRMKDLPIPIYNLSKKGQTETKRMYGYLKNRYGIDGKRNNRCTHDEILSVLDSVSSMWTDQPFAIKGTDTIAFQQIVEKIRSQISSEKGQEQFPMVFPTPQPAPDETPITVSHRVNIDPMAPTMMVHSDQKAASRAIIDQVFPPTPRTQTDQEAYVQSLRAQGIARLVPGFLCLTMGIGASQGSGISQELWDLFHPSGEQVVTQLSEESAQVLTGMARSPLMPHALEDYEDQVFVGTAEAPANTERQQQEREINLPALQERLNAYIQENGLTAGYVIRYNDQEISLNQDHLMPTLSTYKMFFALEYLSTIDQEAWDIPLLERMIVNSENDAAADVLQAIWDNCEDRSEANNPVQLINYRLVNVYGVPGIGSWDAGIFLGNTSLIDMRYYENPITDIQGNVIDPSVHNTTTLRFLADGYSHIANLPDGPVRDELERLGGMPNPYSPNWSPIERASGGVEGPYMAKEGSSPFTYPNGHIIQARIEAGILFTQDGREVVFAFGALEDDSEVADVMAQIIVEEVTHPTLETVSQEQVGSVIPVSSEPPQPTQHTDIDEATYTRLSTEVAIPPNSSFVAEFPELLPIQMAAIEQNINSMYSGVSPEQLPPSIFVALRSERAGVVLRLDGDRYIVESQFPIGVARQNQQIEYIAAEVDERGIIRSSGDPILGDHLMNLHLATGPDTPIEIHANLYTEPVQRVNNSTGCIVLNDTTWAYLDEFDPQNIFRTVYFIPDAFTDPATLFQTTATPDGLQFTSPLVHGTEHIESIQNQMPLFVQNLVEDGTLHTDTHSQFLTFPLISQEFYNGQFQNASSAAQEINTNLPDVMHPGDSISLLSDHILTLQESAGYIQTRNGFSSGASWSVAGMDQALLAASVQLPSGESIPLVTFSPEARSVNTLPSYTYGGFDNQGDRFAANGAMVYMRRADTGEYIQDGLTDYTFTINRALLEYNIEGVSITLVPNTSVRQSISVEVSLVNAPNNVTLQMQNFHSAEEIEQAFQIRTGEIIVQPELTEDAGIIQGGDIDPYNRYNIEPSVEILDEGYQYGFVRINNVPLYSAPDKEAQIPNPARPLSTLGTTYLMYGALVRFEPVDQTWAHIIPDGPRDDEYQGERYIRLQDIQVVDRDEIAEPIGYVSTEQDVGKFLVLNVTTRELTLFEGAIPILKTPVIISPDDTPRGNFFFGNQLLSRNMPNYPGVPYTSFLAGTAQAGFAIHGSPWHLWSQTVQPDEVENRISHGCINVPNWSVQIPYMDETMPVDEFIFRWIGGMQNPSENTYEVADSTTRIIIVNDYSELSQQDILTPMAQAQIEWEDVSVSINEASLNVPESYNETTDQQ